MKAGKITPEQRLMGLLSVRMSRRAQAGATATELGNIRQRFGDIAAKRHIKHQEFKDSTTAQIRDKINKVKGVLPEDAATGVRPRSDPRPVFNNSGDPDVIALRFRQETLPATTLHKGGTRMQAPLHSAKEPDMFSPSTRRTLRNTSLVAGGLGAAGMGAHALLGDPKTEQKIAASSVGDYAKTFGKAGLYGTAAGAGMATGIVGTVVGLNKVLSTIDHLKGVKVTANLGEHEKKANSNYTLLMANAAQKKKARDEKKDPDRYHPDPESALGMLYASGRKGGVSVAEVLGVPGRTIGEQQKKASLVKNTGIAFSAGLGSGALVTLGALGLAGLMGLKQNLKDSKGQEKKAGLGAEALTHVAMTITGGALGLHAGIRGGAVVMRKLLDASKDKRKD